MNAELTRTRTAIAIVALVTGSLLAGTACAQDEHPQVSQARAVFDEGVAHHGDGRFALAAESFQRAYDLLIEAGRPDRAGMVSFNIGTSLDEIPGREREARDAYARFLQEAPADDPAVSERISTVQARMRELEARRGAQGDGDASGGISPIGPIILGVGGATLLAGVIIGGVSLGMASDFNDACADLTACPTSLQAQYDEMRTFSAVTDVLLISGGIIAVTGLVLTVVLTDDGGREATAACGLTGCSVRGTF